MKTIFLLTLASAFFLNSSFPSIENLQDGDRHYFFIQGNHPKELALGTYIVFKTAKAEDSAKKEFDALKRDTNSKAGYGYLSVKEEWVIYLTAIDGDLVDAMGELKKVKGDSKYKETYLLTIHK